MCGVADKKIDVQPLIMAYLRRFQGFLYFLMKGKVIDFGCVLREDGLDDKLCSPMQM